MARNDRPLAPKLCWSVSAHLLFAGSVPLHNGASVPRFTAANTVPVPEQSAFAYVTNVTIPVGHASCPEPPQLPARGLTSAWSLTPIVFPVVTQEFWVGTPLTEQSGVLCV